MSEDAYHRFVLRPLKQGLIVLVGVVLILAAVAGALLFLGQSTWTYSRQPVDTATTDRLARLHADLVAAGAPEAAVRLVARAAHLGAYQGDAIEALAEAERILAAARGDDPSLAAARQELRAVYAHLYVKEYGGCPGVDISKSSTPIVLPLPTQ